MVSNSTPNFGLNQWQADDPVLREDFNADNQKLEHALSMLGNCRIFSGTYTGTGTFGENAPCHLELGFKPLLLFVNTSKNYVDNGHAVWFHPMATCYHPTNENIKFQLTWEDTGVSWYISCSSSYLTATNQFNEEGTEYTFLALGYMP